MARKTICFDLDGTLCTNTFGRYEDAQPYPWAVERVAALARAGHRILIHTARGTATGIDWAETTRGQLARWGVPYDELHFGKPSADVHVDDRAVHTDAWRAGDAFGVPGFPGTAGVLPVSPPAPATCVSESGRTYRGVAPDLEAHVARLLWRADAACIAPLPDAADVAAAVAAALERNPVRGDVVFTATVAEPPGAAHLDLGASDPLVHVACRSLAEPGRALAPMLAGAGTPPAVAATIEAGREGRWPLAERDQRLHDRLGGHVAAVLDGRLVLPVAPRPAPVALLRACAAAEDAGVPVERRPVTTDDVRVADELLLVGLPFCVLAVASLDARAFDAPGPVATQLDAAWSAATGSDISGQTLALAEQPETALPVAVGS